MSIEISASPRRWTMRLARIGMLALVLMVPLAVADQDISAGPAHVQTLSASSGGGCSSTNGYESHSATATVTFAPNEQARADYVEYCSRYDDGSFAYTSQGQYVQVARVHGSNWGPAVSYGWSTFQDNFGTNSCQDSLYLSGPALNLGCLMDPSQRVLVGQYLP